MKTSKKPSVWKRIWATVTAAFIQDVPSELSACEICRRTECNAEEWLNCEMRLAAARFLQTEELTGLEQLRQARHQRASDGPERTQSCPLIESGRSQ